MLSAQKSNKVTDSLFRRLDLFAKLAAHGFGHFRHTVLPVDEVPQKTPPLVEPDLSHG